MDPNANNGPVNPEPNPPTPPKPHDIAEAGPINPATGQPDHGAEVTELKGWFRENLVSLIITAVVVTLVCVYLDPLDTLKVVIGLGFIIFIHELGHFLAAKWCDVHVRTFSIGFGPAVPFCSYKWGETTYMIGIIPLGGYVAMVGEGEGAENDEEAEEDPRSFRKKSVWQRMMIISAGVIMNIIFGMACFVAAYLHGVQEKPATVGSVESGSAAWRAGMRTGDHIVKIGSRDNPSFDDVRPIVMSTSENEQLPIDLERNGQPLSSVKHVSPIRDEGQRFPQLGITPPQDLTLISGNKRKVKPTYPGSPAAVSAEGAKFEPGDRVVKMTDPGNPKGEPTPVANYSDYYQRMVLLAADPITFEVQRKDSGATARITVPPAYRHDLGMRMRMGDVVAVRAGGPADGKVVAGSTSPKTRGDRIKAVLLPPDASGERLWFVAGLDFAKYPQGGVDFAKPEFKTDDPNKVKTAPLDPVLLPRQLGRWAADKAAKLPVELVVMREDKDTHTEVAHRVALDFDPSFRFDRETVYQVNSPMPISGLGLAYQVDPIVDEVVPGGPAADAKTTPGQLSTGWWHRFLRAVGAESRDAAPGGEHKPLQPNDVIVAVRLKTADEAGNVHAGEWQDDIKDGQWASVDSAYQIAAPEIDLRVKRGGDTFEVTLKGRDAREWPLDERGLLFQTEPLVVRATDVGDAIRLGGLRTVRFIKTVYMNLYAMVAGRVSPKTMSGPLTIANVSYKLAGEDLWQFLLFLGMISVNLAVVNFLPIPVLDGGHMVFLIYEKVTGRPLPERIFAFAMYTGLFLILSLMVFVLFLDVKRLFFGWF